MKHIKNPWVHKEGYNCIGCSPDNPIGLHLQFEADEDEQCVWAQWQPTKNHEGWIGVLHGGVQAMIMDECAEWWLTHYRKTCGVTSRLEIKYMHEVMIAKGPVRTKVSHTRDLRQFTQLHVELYDGSGQLCTTADATFYQFHREKAIAEMDFPADY